MRRFSLATSLVAALTLASSIATACMPYPGPMPQQQPVPEIQPSLLLPGPTPAPPLAHTATLGVPAGATVELSAAFEAGWRNRADVIDSKGRVVASFDSAFAPSSWSFRNDGPAPVRFQVVGQHEVDGVFSSNRVQVQSGRFLFEDSNDGDFNDIVLTVTTTTPIAHDDAGFTPHFAVLLMTPEMPSPALITG